MKYAARILGTLAVVVLGAVATVWWLNVRGDSQGGGSLPTGPTGATGSTAAPGAATPADRLARGAYLARAGNCMACHTDRGGAPYAGGRAIVTPFGTVFTSNLTPHDTGLGGWTSDDFWRALHNGRSRDGRLLYPAFPYPNYTLVTRDDSDALFDYLQSLPPADAPNRPHALRWPYGTQPALAVWRALFFSPQAAGGDAVSGGDALAGDAPRGAAQSAEWRRGAYLVQGLGHCSACHTPRNALGATDEALSLNGGLIPMQNWYAPSLTSPSEAGVAHWDAADVVALLKTGISTRGAVSGPMAEVVLQSTQYLNDADLHAMAAYLRSLPPTDEPAGRAAPAAAAPAEGARLYAKHCAQCHGEAGQGVARAYPPLAGNRAVTMATTSNLVQIVLNGGFAPATAGNPRPFGMPPFATVLGDADVARILTYIRNAWGNRAAEVPELDVARYRGQSR